MDESRKMEWMKIDENGHKLMKVDRDGCNEMKMDDNG